MTIKLPPLPEHPEPMLHSLRWSVSERQVINTHTKACALMALQEAMNECKKECAEWGDGMGASGAHLCFIRLRALRTELEAS